MLLDDEWELFLISEYIIDWFGYYLERFDFILENEILRD
jgi:hypothetical protein